MVNSPLLRLAISWGGGSIGVPLGLHGILGFNLECVENALRLPRQVWKRDTFSATLIHGSSRLYIIYILSICVHTSKRRVFVQKH